MNYYTLEFHLEKVCLENKEFEILDSIWKLNKRTLTSALSNINFNFPHYSQHETSHSNTIISNIESFLGEDRIKILEPTDTWLLLMSSYSHDLGMIILNKTIEESLPNDTLLNFLKALSEQNRDKDLKEAAKLLLSITKEPLPINKSIFDLRKSIVYVIGEFFRQGHAQRSKEIIDGRDIQMRELLSNFYSNLIPNRFLNLLSEISFSHGVDFDYLLNNLQYESNGISRDKIHPRFIASMLRFGDLLDVDDKRFNPISELLLDNSLPETSEQHKIKHASIKHLLIRPSSIEVTVDCPNAQVYRIARQWFDWLEDEVEVQYRNWSIISPPNLNSLPPKINSNGVKVLFNSTIADADLMNLRFSINPQKAIEIFEGKGIYEESAFVFLRELVQNAVDASKLQLWKDITNGNYNELLYENLKGKYNELTIENKFKSKDFIKYPSDIPIEVYRNYQVDLFVNWADDNKKNILFKVVDKGSGISRVDLLRMTQKVGESRSNDADYQEMKKTMPYWLKPTGAFGLGLQSVFLVSDSFVVKTKADNDISYEIVFNSSKNGEYSYIRNFNAISQRGTTVEVVVSEEKFSDAFGNSYSMDIVFDYDYFSSDDSIQISKVEEYVNQTLINIEELNVFITNKGKVKSSIFSALPSDYNKGVVSFISSVSKDETKMSCFKDGSFLTNFFDVSGNLGSQIKTIFIDNFESIYSRNYELKYNYLYMVRDIPIKDNQYGFRMLPFCAMQWNLLNPDSDKILNISRSKLIQDVKYEHNEILLEKIFPNLLNLIWEAYVDNSFKNKIKELGVSDESYNISLFHILQTSKIFGIEREIPSIFNSFYFPLESIIHKSSVDKVSFEAFLKCSEFSILKIGKEYNKKEALDTYILSILDDIKGNSETKIIALYQEYFSNHLINYNLEKITTFIASSDGMEIRLLKYSKTTQRNDYAYMPENLEKNYLKSIIRTCQRVRQIDRTIIPSLKDYHEILSVNNTRYTFNHNYNSEFSNYIISPIKNNSELELVLESYNETISQDDLGDTIYKNAIEKVVPDKLINWIIDNTTKKKNRTKESILKAYLKLLAEALIEHNRKDKALEKKE